MKRDMELVREILLAIEETESTRIVFSNMKMPERVQKYNPASVIYHCSMLYDRKLVIGEPFAGAFFVSGITWEGYDFLDNARDQTIWSKAISITKGGTWEILNYVLASLIKGQVDKMLNAVLSSD